MSYLEHGMQEILNVLRRASRGESKQKIAAVTGRSRSTVRRWLGLAEDLGWKAGVEADEELARAVLERLRPGVRGGDPGETERRLEPHREQLLAWLKPERAEESLRLTKVHELLGRLDVRVPYSSLHRYAVTKLGFGEHKRLTVRVADVSPGEVAEVDFGKLGPVHDPVTGRRRVLWALLVTLVHSRHQFVHTTFSQKTADLVDGLEDAWDFFGGVPARVILDNLKAAVTKPDRYDPFFQRTFEEYADYRGFVIDAAVVRDPTGKPHVERNVQYLRESFFRGETWLDRDHVQRGVVTWCHDVAGQRVHGTTRQRPLEVFEAVERAALRPLAAERFDPPKWGRCNVHGDHHIVFGKALYSVPTRWVGTEVEVRGDRGLVRIYARGALVKTHPRKEPGGRSTDHADYPKELAPYAMRHPERMIKDAGVLGTHVGRFMSELLTGPFPWSKLRQAQKLLRMATRHGRERVDAACARALGFGLVDVRRVERIVLTGLDRGGARPAQAPPGQLVLLPPRFLREPKSFLHSSKPTTHEERHHGTQTIAPLDPQAPAPLGTPADAPGPSLACSQDQDD
jgi:transposase